MNETPILWPSAFPLRIVRNVEEFEPAGWEVWTREDTAPGSLNNFAVCTGIQHDDEADWICKSLNAAAGY